MSTPREIELKLEVSPEDLDRLDSNLLNDLVGATRPTTKTIASVYFDTRKQRLRRHGLTLRVRKTGRKHLQTIKQNGVAGSPNLSRGEWETQIAGTEPDLAAAHETPLSPVLGKSGRDALQAMFETRVRRSVVRLRSGKSEIELALDRGEIEAGDRKAPVSELELELKRGEPAELFRLARSIAERVPVRLALRSKSERGYDLLDGGSGGAVKAALVALSPDLTSEQAFRAVAWSCLRQLLDNLPVFERGDADGLHQMRVALRRLRAAISLFAGMLQGAETDAMKAELRWLAQEFAQARQLDVLLTRVDEGDAGGQPGGLGVPDLNLTLNEQRAAAFERARRAAHSARFRMLLLDVAAWIETGAWTSSRAALAKARREAPITATAEEQLNSRRKKIVKRGSHLQKLDVDRRHQVRIQAKKLRYASEFFADAFPGKKAARRRKAFLDALKLLQERLGELNDIAAHEALTASIAERGSGEEQQKSGRRRAFAAGRVSGREGARHGPLLAAAEKAHTAFVDAKPFWD